MGQLWLSKRCAVFFKVFFVQTRSVVAHVCVVASSVASVVLINQHESISTFLANLPNSLCFFTRVGFAAEFNESKPRVKSLLSIIIIITQKFESGNIFTKKSHHVWKGKEDFFSFYCISSSDLGFLSFIILYFLQLFYIPTFLALIYYKSFYANRLLKMYEKILK